ncbi:MAG TPA: DUF4157 domain-containing protein, partial [Candidatus Elarobacter sp.]
MARAACACGGGCPRCAVRPKLAVGASSDPAEREADRLANQVMRAPRSDVSPVGSAAGEPMVRRASDGGDAERGAATASSGNSAARYAGVPESIASEGAPLPASTREFFELRFGRDFSDVRVH